MPTKTEQLQIRVTPQQKVALRRRARAAGVDVSTYVLSRVLPPAQDRFADILRSFRAADDRRYTLAALNDFLSALAPIEYAEAVAVAAIGDLSPLLQNYVAALVEQAAAQKNVVPPAWVFDIEPLTDPYFATSLKSVRPYLLQVSPVPFKRRNIFVDAGVGARV